MNQRTPESKKKKWVGIVFLVIGLLMLSKQLGVFIPGWVVSWPMLLILIGLITGRKHNYQNPGSYILIIIGGIFLLDDIFSGINFHDFAWPVAIMGLGLYLILGKKKHFKRPLHDSAAPSDEWDKRVYPEEAVSSAPAGETTSDADPYAEADAGKIRDKDFNGYAGSSSWSTEDYLDTVAIFGGVKKNIVSRSFKEGDITTIMGGAELNFIQADIQGTAILEVTQIFGGTKIIVPPNWKVASEMVAIFGGVEDKRPVVHGAIPAEDKILIIRGTSIFGGIDIKSY